MKGDIQKVIEIKEKWTKVDVKQLRHAKSIDMTTQNSKEFDLPHLRINYTQIEKNRLIQLKRRIINTESNTSLQSDDYNISPQRQSRASALSQCLLPSNQFTRKQNIKILDQLYASVKTLKESNSQQQEKLIQKLLNTRNGSRQKESQKLNTFITSPQNRSIYTEINLTQQSQFNESYQNKNENKQSASKSLIERQVINEDGNNYPFNLYIINKTRQQYLDTVTDNQNRKRSLDQYGNQQENHVQRIKRQFESSIEESVKRNEFQKQRKDMISRGSSNAYYGYLALDRKSKRHVKRLNLKLPSDSRFYTNLN
ncbi:hypothetical protein pb186bvf_016467 [Paramecium bursaria]